MAGPAVLAVLDVLIGMDEVGERGGATLPGLETRQARRMTSGTERAARRFAGIEDWPTADLVAGIVEGQIAGAAAVLGAAAAIARAVDAAALRLAEGGRLIYAGAGSSGRMAAQDAAELPPTFSWPHERAVSIMAVEGAEDNRDAAREALARLELVRNDVVVSVAASGNTPFALAALEHAREVGALAVGIYNNPEGALGATADIAILVDTGPEIVAGSTRMKAGTAQKVVLNCISTAIMIRLGFVHRGLMVEMKPTNRKLRLRAERIVAELAAGDAQAAAQALADAGGSIKLATVMLLKSLPRAEAEALLASAAGNLRAALR